MSDTAFLTGRIYWCRAFGPPHPNYEEDGNEWTFELEATPETQKWLEENGLDKLKKDRNGNLKLTPDGSPYIRFTRPEFRRDGEKNKPFRVVDDKGFPWDTNKLIGNGSLVRVKVRTKTYEIKKRQIKGLYADGFQVGIHVPYGGGDDFGEWNAAPAANTPATKAPVYDDIDDDPFA